MLSTRLPRSLALSRTTDIPVVARGHDGIWTAIARHLRENGRTPFSQYYEGDGHDLQKLQSRFSDSRLVVIVQTWGA
jgi:hypothetical protein